MTVATETTEESEKARARRGWWPRTWLMRILLFALVLVIVAAITAWMNRETIVTNVIDDALESYGLEARYDVVSIGPRRQIIENLVIGDPDSPDLTAQRVIVHLEYGFFTAGIGRVEVAGARAFGTYREGQFSLGSLDKVLFAESEEPFALPDFDLVIRDARARIDSDYGQIGAKFDGEGNLSSTFSGQLAATAPGMGIEGCRAQTATLFGDLSMERGAPRFSGPVRARQLVCNGARIANVDIDSTVSTNDAFDEVDGTFEIAATGLAGFDMASRTLGGTATLDWADGKIKLGHDLTARGITTGFGNMAQLVADGSFRSAADDRESQWDVRFDGEGVAFPLSRVRALDDALAGSTGTLAEPLLIKLRRGLARSAADATIGGEATFRFSDEGTSVIVPEARVRSARGESLLTFSRLSWRSGGQLAGDLLTGGADLPRIAGRMRQAPDGSRVFVLTMDQYAAGQSRLSIPEIEIRQRSDGAIAFDGLVNASGPVPGGSIQGLRLPLEGQWSMARGLVVGQRCAPVTFARFTYENFSLDGRTVLLCPDSGGAILSYGDSLRVGAKAGGLSLTGEIGGGPIQIDADGASFAYPGRFTANNVAVRLGREGNEVNITAPDIWGSFDDGVGGEFSEVSATIDNVPLLFDEASGSWRLEGYKLIIDDAAVRTSDLIGEDEQRLPRFYPLFATDATLTLEGVDLVVNADLREPGYDSLVTSVRVDHDVQTGRGRALLTVPGLTFNRALQPDDLTYLTEGVIADVAGTISGEGRITWGPEKVESSGEFSTRKMDLAAAFGPAEDIRGTIVFSDLLNLTTERNQVLNVGSVNPGIEALDGVVTYDLTNGSTLRITDAQWPFLKGRLILQPLTVEFGKPQGQLYVFELIGVDAGTFVSEMEIGNIAATGTFDGTIPIYFDEYGFGEVRGGLMISRPPGGNIAYVGELTYEDLGYIGNFAFNSLRSLDYTQMMIALNGSLGGEIITGFRFDGISQGQGANRNLITRQIAKLPIRFNVTVRTDNFYDLSRVIRSYFDASYLPDPEAAGVIIRDAEGNLVPRTPAATSEPEEQGPPEEEPSTDNEAVRDDESPVQPPESEELP